MDRVEEEIRDRFGALPEPAAHLVALRRLRALARAVRARVVTVRGGFVEVELSEAFTRGAIERLIRAAGSLSLEFEAGTRTAVRTRGRGSTLETAGALLVALAEATRDTAGAGAASTR